VGAKPGSGAPPEGGGQLGFKPSVAKTVGRGATDKSGLPVREAAPQGWSETNGDLLPK
jgi:hypothetical protein